MGFVFQGFNLLKALTATENVRVALTLNGVRGKEARERSRAVLEEVGLADHLDFYPIDMSWGQKQRVSVARAVVHGPGLVLADEPTGNLDSRTGHSVAELLRTMASDHGTAVVIVTHDSRLADIADRVVYLEDGMTRDGGAGWH